MIVEELIFLFIAFSEWFVNLLPAVNTDFITKYQGLVDYIYDHFIVLAYYYLPVVTIQWWFSRTITYVLAVLGLRLLADFIGAVTPIKLPWKK